MQPPTPAPSLVNPSMSNGAARGVAAVGHLVLCATKAGLEEASRPVPVKTLLSQKRNHQGMVNVLPLQKDFMASCTPSL